MNRTHRIACFLLTCLTPSICLALGDGIEGAAILEALVKFEFCWTLFVIAVFLLLLLRKISFERRLAYCVILWCAQIFVPWVYAGWSELSGVPGTKITEKTKQPVVLAGATFPAGSEAEYVQIGGGYWRRRLIQVDSSQPVRLGPWQITYLSFDSPLGYDLLQDKIARARLVRPQNIDGWPCGASISIDVGSGAPRLAECELISAKVIGDLTWPAGTSVDRREEGWALGWFNDNDGDGHNAPPQAFGFSVEFINATYSNAHELLTWKGDASEGEVKVGDYAFERRRSVHLGMMESGDILIHGYARELTTGADVSCVHVQLRDRSARRCQENEKVLEVQ